jgi:hypothetical protein
MTRRDGKIIAGTVTVIGAILSVFDKIYALHHLLLESSPDYPEPLGTLGWLCLLVAPLIYIALDFTEAFGKNRAEQSEIPQETSGSASEPSENDEESNK